MQNLTKPVIFHNETLNIEISGMLYKGKPVFFAVEVAKALGYEKPHQALEYNCKSLIKINFLQCKELGLGERSKGIILLTEPDLYRLIMRSKLPSAEKVQDWVCEDVLPSIRQTGGYQLPQHPVPQSFSEALMLAAELAKKNELLTDERDEALRTKAQISEKREATACQRNAVYQRIANKAIKEREEMAALLGASKDYASVRSVWRATGNWYSYRQLTTWQDEHDAMESYYWDESTDARILCYPREAWLEVYDVDIAKLF
ncbi:BRO family protein [Symbiopectobacterium sp. RP]|uniref:BRO-N domain-containing protein n=1 Tax=Symbiopectobacterium sp. RP TaxID=3248553 RepID=UPI003D2A8B43